MKRSILFAAFITVYCINVHAQITQINSNKSLQPLVPLITNRTILVSGIDSSIWVTDGTLAGTVPITTTIKMKSFEFGVLNNKMIFRGSTPTTGSELYITDGTPGGTVLVKDIVSGAAGSDPAEMVRLGNFLYFTAVTVAEGRELWRTDGTSAGTTLVKDIIPGSDSSNSINSYHLYSTGSYLLFAAKTPSSGIELYRSDGTSEGTVVLSDINAGADSSNPDHFFLFNNMVLFVATDAAHGSEIWKTNGTPEGTSLVKDINPGVASSTTFSVVFPGVPPQEFTVFTGFHVFNNKAYFQANDGVTGSEVWSTDGTEANTFLLKDIIAGASLSLISVIDAINLPGKFIFPVSDGSTRSELWESDGTTAGTKLFKAFTPIDDGNTPFIYLDRGFNQVNGTITYPLFQGNKFFFSVALNQDEGYELWISDGTVEGTHIVKDINTGGNGIDVQASLSYIYTTTTLFFAGNDGSAGDELWMTDGTSAGTRMVFDINPGGSGSNLQFSYNAFGKILFTATDGDDADHRDLYVLDGTFSPLPVELSEFTVAPSGNDALLHWTSSQEVNTRDFTVQRSSNAQDFEDIGTVQAVGNSSSDRGYSFKDLGIANSGKSIVYYRLVIADKDGKSKNSKVISLKLKGTSDWNVRLLTNPVHNDLTLTLSGITEGIQLSIMDVGGKIVYKNSLQSVNGQLSLPISSLQKGTYIIVAEFKNERKTIKFLKQ